MKQNKTEEQLLGMPRKELIALVASKIKGRSLFPEQVKRAKEILSRARFVNGAEKLFHK
jgi:hypothetical protein